MARSSLTGRTYYYSPSTGDRPDFRFRFRHAATSPKWIYILAQKNSGPYSKLMISFFDLMLSYNCVI